MADVHVHRLRYAYSDGSTVPNVDTDDQQRLSELMNDGWKVVSHSVVALGPVSATSVLSSGTTVAYEAHLLLQHPDKGV